MTYLRVIIVLLVALVLTAATQIGGLVYLLSMISYKTIDTKFNKTADRIAVKMLAFFMLYFLTVFLIVPVMARPFGRVPLPLGSTRGLQPGTILTFLLNRNYVTPSLRETIFQATDELNKRYPGTRVNYLDANFPFFDGFPLPPHLSHNDGKKLDLSFSYRDAKTGNITND